MDAAGPNVNSLFPQQFVSGEAVVVVGVHEASQQGARQRWARAHLLGQPLHWHSETIFFQFNN